MPKRRPRGHHDKLFKATFQVPVNAQAELELVLPAALRRRLRLSAVTFENTEFVHAQSTRRSDLLMRVPRRKKSSGDAFIYILFEHQSTVDKLMPLRLLRYLVRIYARFAKNGKLPLVVPVVLAVGDAFIPNFRFMLDDVSHVPDKAFVRMVKRSGQAAAVRMLLRDSRDLNALRASLPTIVRYAEDLEEIEAFVVEAFGEKHAKEIHATIGKEAKMARKKFVSIADGWRAEKAAAVEAAAEKGEAKGRAAALRLIVSERFGPIPAAVDAAIAAATSDDLELLLRRAVSAATPLDLIRP